MRIDLSNVKDKLGTVINPGDYIVYGHLLNCSAALKIGKVLDIKERQASWQSEPDGVSIIVWGVEDGFSSPNYSRDPKLQLKKGALQFPERVIVLKREDVPEVYLNLLDPVTVDRKGTNWWTLHKNDIAADYIFPKEEV